MKNLPPRFWTLGHSDHDIDEFLGLLRRHDIEVVADVRSVPYSRFAPQYRKDQLAKSLREAGLKYVFLGDQLGARPKGPDCYRDGRVSYELLAKTHEFLAGLDRLFKGADDFRIAILCSEKDPATCHRALLVSRALVGRGAVVDHILADGTLEPHEATMLRVLDLVGLPREDLFRSRDDLIREGLARQEERIAHVETTTSDVRARSAS